jgi:hypothetical protein
MFKKSIMLLGTLVVATGMCLAQEQPAPKPVVKPTPIKRTSPASRKEMYVAYGTACHGADGNGNGPGAGSLNAPPTDLTPPSKKHDGKFPANSLASTLKFGNGPSAPGSTPVWARGSSLSTGFMTPRFSNVSAIW